MTGDPGIGNTTSIFRKPEYLNYRGLFYKLKNAITHKAAGVILINDPLTWPNYPTEEDPTYNATEGGGNRFSVISGYATNHFVDQLLKKNKLNTYKLQMKIARTQKPSSFKLNISANMSVHLKKKTGRVSNIVGVIKGSDPVLSHEVVVIGAHMDHLGFGGESSAETGSLGQIHNGADDNASGTAMVLALAKRLKMIAPKRTHVFVLFNAEEMGLLGSNHFVTMWPTYEKDYGIMKAMINFDMVGRYNKDLSLMGTDSSAEWNKIVNVLIPNDFSVSTKKIALGSSDHASFIHKKIPSLFITTGAHEDYHRSTDDTEKINFLAMEKVKLYAFNIIDQLDHSSKITFNNNYSTGAPAGGTGGYGAHLGCIPEFGQSDEIVGVKCTGTSEKSPARLAGVVAGDIIVEIGDIEIKNLYDLSFALKYYRAGDKISLAWMRGEQLFKQIIVLGKSQRQK